MRSIEKSNPWSAGRKVLPACVPLSGPTSRYARREWLEHIAQCDQEIENVLHQIEPPDHPVGPALPTTEPLSTKAKRRAGDFHFEVREEGHRLLGVDCHADTGHRHAGATLLSEIGNDLSRFPTARHFASWLDSARTMTSEGARCCGAGCARFKIVLAKCSAWLPTRFIAAKPAWAVSCAVMKYKLVPKAATTATAHKIALVTKQVEYDDSLWADQDAAPQPRAENKLKGPARHPGYEIAKPPRATTA